MKKYLLLTSCFVFTFSFATKKTIIATVNNTFDPSVVTISVGDTIVFYIGSNHTATEVTQSTWNANGTTASGSFNLGVGNNQLVTGLTTGTHYFVCQVHVASMAMKGTITVNLASSIKNKIINNNLLSIFPNPTKDFLMLKTDGIVFEKIVITSLDGKASKEILLSPATDKISIIDLPNANYILTAYTKENDVYVQKFVKE